MSSKRIEFPRFGSLRFSEVLPGCRGQPACEIQECVEADVRHGSPCSSETALKVRCQDIGTDQDIDFQQRIVGLQFDNHFDPARFQGCE